MTVSVASAALRQPFFHAKSAIAEPSSCATLPKLNARLPFAPNRFGPIWSVPMNGATASTPALIDAWTTGAAKSTSQVVKMMLAPWPRSFVAQAFAIAGLLPCVSQVRICSGRPLTPPLALTCATRSLAAASAGPSNGAIAPLLSKAQPITIGLPAGDAPPAKTAAAAATTPNSAATASPLLRLMLSPPLGVSCSGECRLGSGPSALEVRDDLGGEQLLRLDRLPVLDAARVDGDGNLGQPVADLAYRLDALDHVLRRPDPDDILLDHLVVRHVAELLHEPGCVEAVAGAFELLLRLQLVRVLEQHGRVALEEAAHHRLRLALRRRAVLVDVARVDPDDIGLVAVLARGRPVDVELLAQRLVREQRRDDHRVALLAGEPVRVVARPAEEDPEAVRDRPRHDVRVLDFGVRAVAREALVLERVEQHLEPLLVDRARLRNRHACLRRNPAVAAADAELVAAVRQHVEEGDPRREHGRVVVRQHVHEGTEADVARPRQRRREQRQGVRRRAELREEEVLDRGVRVVAEPVGVDDLLQDLRVKLPRLLARPALDLGVDAEFHGCDRLTHLIFDQGRVTLRAMRTTSRHRTMAEAALEELREAIILGELVPGAPLRLEDLARSLGMSISPIRGAVRRLEALGLAAHVPHHGAKVVALDIEELRELFSIRLALETMAVRRAAKLFEAEDEQAARSHLAELDGARRAGAARTAVRAHTAFHFT